MAHDEVMPEGLSKREQQKRKNSHSQRLWYFNKSQSADTERLVILLIKC